MRKTKCAVSEGEGLVGKKSGHGVGVMVILLIALPSLTKHTLVTMSETINVTATVFNYTEEKFTI